MTCSRPTWNYRNSRQRQWLKISLGPNCAENTDHAQKQQPQILKQRLESWKMLKILQWNYGGTPILVLLVPEYTRHSCFHQNLSNFAHSTYSDFTPSSVLSRRKNIPGYSVGGVSAFHSREVGGSHPAPNRRQHTLSSWQEISVCVWTGLLLAGHQPFESHW